MNINMCCNWLSKQNEKSLKCAAINFKSLKLFKK